MPNKTTKSYIEILADTVGNLFGFATVATGGAVIAATTAVASATAGISVATTATGYNQFTPLEKQVDTYSKSIEAATYIADSGYRAFNYVNPMLFSLGHTAGSMSVKAAASTLGGIYNSAQSCSVAAEPEVKFTDVEDGWCKTDLKLTR